MLRTSGDLHALALRTECRTQWSDTPMCEPGSLACMSAQFPVLLCSTRSAVDARSLPPPRASARLMNACLQWPSTLGSSTADCDSSRYARRWQAHAYVKPCRAYIQRLRSRMPSSSSQVLHCSRMTCFRSRWCQSDTCMHACMHALVHARMHILACSDVYCMRTVSSIAASRHYIASTSVRIHTSRDVSIPVARCTLPALPPGKMWSARYQRWRRPFMQSI